MFVTTFRRGDRVSRIDATAARGSFIRRDVDAGVAIVEWDGFGQTATPFEFVRHAPVTVVGSQPTPPLTTCPECGHELTIDSEALKGTPQPDGRVRYRTVRAAFCGFCDFIQEVPR